MGSGRVRKSLAWIGSANFTGPGFDGNEELVYETEEAEDMAKWFGRRWEAVGPQDDQPERYCEGWTPPRVPMHGVAAQRRNRSRRSSPNAGPEVIVFFQEGGRPTPFTGKGTKRQSPAAKSQLVTAAYRTIRL